MRRVSIAGAAALALVSGLLVGSPATATVAGPTWTQPAQTLSQGTKNDETPGAVVDAKGNATVVYWKGTHKTGAIMATRRPAGGSWSTPTSISGPFSTRFVAQLHPQAVVDAKGNVTAAWAVKDKRKKTFFIEMATMKPNGTWSKPVTVSPTGYPSFDPQLAVDAAGDVYMAWLAATDNSGNLVVLASMHKFKHSWKPIAKLSTSATSAAEPSEAVDAAGSWAVVWRADDSGAQTSSVEAATRTSGTAWQAAQQLSTANAGNPAVAVAATDSFDVVWAEDDGTNYVIEYSSSTAATQTLTSWSSPTALSTDGQDADAPQIAVDEAGDVGVVWERGVQSGSSSLFHIEAAMLPQGGNWSSPATLSENTTYDSTSPRVVTDAAGDFTAAWVESDGSNYQAHGAVWPAGGGSWSPPSTLSSGAKDSFGPALAASTTGNVAALWSRYNGTWDRIQESQYDQAPPVTKMTMKNITLRTNLKIPASWSATDWSGVSSYDTQIRVTSANVPTTTSWLSGVTDTSGTYAGQPGMNYCISARATDIFGNVGAYSPEKCVITPIDDSSATASAGWTEKHTKGFFQGTQMVSSTKGATLTFSGVGVRKIALLVEQTPDSDFVTVSLDKGYTTINFGDVAIGKSTTVKKKIIMLHTGLSSDEFGSLVITNQNGTVHIDGVYAIR